MQRYTLQKKQRLTSPIQFKAVYRSEFWGNSAHHSFNIRCSASKSSQAKLGVTVSKKVSKKAVDRNSIKRQIREYFRYNQHTLLANTELVITAKPSCANATTLQQQGSLMLLWKKILKWQRWYQHNKQSEYK